MARCLASYGTPRKLPARNLLYPQCKVHGVLYSRSLKCHTLQEPAHRQACEVAQHEGLHAHPPSNHAFAAVGLAEQERRPDARVGIRPVVHLQRVHLRCNGRCGGQHGRGRPE